jgi:hypothetical protein
MADLVKVVNMIPNLSSGETNQDSEPNLAVNPDNPLEMVGTAFTPSPNLSTTRSPVFYSSDGGNTWSLRDIIAGTPVRDQTVRFSSTGGMLYAGVLWGPGGLSTINFNIQRGNNFSGAVAMTSLNTRVNDDQPFVQAATVPSGPSAGKDRVYVGSNDHAPANVPATMDLSLDAAAAVPTVSTFRLEARTVSRDGFPTRPAVHTDGTVYAIFYSGGFGASDDVVIVRDDNWATSATPFLALIDPGDLKQGVRLAIGVVDPYNSISLGQQRIGSDLSIAVDPGDSSIVYVAFGDNSTGTYTLRIRKSTDSGATWSGDLRTVTNATNPALAIDSAGVLGFLYQHVTGIAPNQRWVTTLEHTRNDFATVITRYLSNTPAATPLFAGNPYLGDYIYMLALGRTFYGIFSANNTPDLGNFPNGVTYQRNANFTTHTLLANDNITPVAVSIDPFFFKVVVDYPTVVTTIADSGNFGRVCLGSFADEILTIDNSGTGSLLISSITAAPADFLAPSVLSYPIKVEAGGAIDVVIRFQPTAAGTRNGTVTIISDDPASPHIVRVSGDGVTSRLSLVVPDKGDWGRVCVGSFVDRPVILNNSGSCTLSITSISSSSTDFIVPEVLSLPLTVGPGDALPLPIRFQPSKVGSSSATITINSSDPAGVHTVQLTGDAPSGTLAVSGSLCFGGVKACCRAERTLSICNVGECPLHVTSVRFKRKNPHWKLINNPFPATLHPGSCLGVVIRYKATEKCPVCCELVITSDDPDTPVKTLDVMAYTVWGPCGCAKCCDDCRKGCCDKKHNDDCCCQGAADDCCQDEDED